MKVLPATLGASDEHYRRYSSLQESFPFLGQH
jgi:hypothetical protein